jgi:acetyl esterase/lipase
MLLAERLRAAGVPVEAMDYEGVTHEFFGMGAAVADAKAAQGFVGQRLRQAFASPGS